MKEWRPFHAEQPRELGGTVQFNWKYEGDLKLDLVLMGPANEGLGRPYFDMVRYIDHEGLFDVIETAIPEEYARQFLKDHGAYIDELMRAVTTEQLETYCEEHFLPLPPGYKEAFFIASQKDPQFDESHASFLKSIFESWDHSD